MKNFLAQAPSVDPKLKEIFGTVKNPGLGGDTADPYGTLLNVLNLGLNLILVIAGLMTLFMFIIAGFTYMTAGGDSKKIEEAQNRMIFAGIGLGIIVAAPVIAGVIGFVVFGDWKAILRPEIMTIDDFKTP